MKFLNIDIRSIILSNLHIKDIKKSIKATKCLELLRPMVRIFTTEQTFELKEEHTNAILQSNILNTEYSIPIPKALKKGLSTNVFWIECLTQGVSLIFKSPKIIYLNLNKKSCSLLHTGKVYNKSINKENLTLAIYYKDKKLNRKSLKVYNAEGNVIYYVPVFEYKIKRMVYFNDSIYYTVPGRRCELRQINLLSKENNLIYNKAMIEKLFIKKIYLFTVIKNAIVLFDTTTLQQLSIVKLNGTPKSFTSLSDSSCLVLHGDGLFYEFNIESQSFKRLYFDFDKNNNDFDNPYCCRIYSENKDCLIIWVDNIYYIINKLNMAYIFKGYCDYDNFYIDGVNNKIFRFLYSAVGKNNFLKVLEYELIDFTKIININNLFPNENIIYMNYYQIPFSKNFLINFNWTEEVYYYHYLSNKAVKVLETTSLHLTPISDTFISYKDDQGIIMFNIFTKTKTIIAKCFDLIDLEKINDFLLILGRTNITLYNLKLKYISYENNTNYLINGKCIGFGIYFDKLLFLVSNSEKIIYTIKFGQLEKVWGCSKTNFIGIYSDDEYVYIFTKDNQMIYINKDATLLIKPVTKENIMDTNIELDHQNLLLRLIKASTVIK
jgi:hypothetical protein